jgi:hypothetical protein
MLSLTFDPQRVGTVSGNGVTTGWRMEIVRQLRTHRLLGIAALFALVGCFMPIMEANMRSLMEHSAQTRAVAATLPDPTAASGMAAYLSQIAQLGLVVLIVSAAGPLCPYGKGMPAAYHRMLTRSRGSGWLSQFRVLIMPRYTVLTAVSVLVYLLGVGCAAYETTVLIGTPVLGRVIASTLLFCLFLAWLHTLIALLGALTGSMPITAGLTVLCLVIGGILEKIPVVGQIVPTGLVENATTALQTAPTGSVWTIVATTLVSGVAMLVAAGFALNRKEL